MQPKVVRTIRLNISVDCVSLWCTLRSTLSILNHKLKFGGSVYYKFFKLAFTHLLTLPGWYCWFSFKD